MKELLQIIHALEAGGAGLPAGSSAAALATLVSVEGSSYRRVGARMLWRGDGAEVVGGISGGCLEDDLIAHCREVAAGEVAAGGVSRVVTYDTRDENDLVWGVGTGCNGVVRVLVEAVRGVPPALAFVRDAWARREAAVLVTRFSRAGDLSGAGGEAVFAAGERGDVFECAGGSGARHVEALRGRANECLRARKSITVSQTEAPGARTGESYLIFEYMPPPVLLHVFGAGRDAPPLERMAEELGWVVRVHAGHAAPSFDEMDARAAAVVMTHRYLHDVPLMRALLPRGLAYLGLLGPKKRAEKILVELARDGMRITAEMRERLHAPVGLDLGGVTPETVALAILAEIQSVLAGRDARPLRGRKEAIHGERGD